MTYDNPIGKYFIMALLAVLLIKYLYMLFRVMQSIEENVAYAYTKQETKQENHSKHYNSYKKQDFYRRDEVKKEKRQVRIPGKMSRFSDELKFFKNCKDSYEILNCSTYATKSMIKKNYRQLALKWHPDTITGRGATQEEITQATQILQIINIAYPEALRRAA